MSSSRSRSRSVPHGAALHVVITVLVLWPYPTHATTPPLSPQRSPSTAKPPPKHAQLDPRSSPNVSRLALTEPARVDRPASTSPFETNLPLDVSIAVAGALSNLGPLFVKSRPPDSLSMRAQNVNAMDRSVIGNHSSVADSLSTGLMAASIVLPVAADLIDVLRSKPADGYRGFAQDALILAEVYAVQALIGNVVKMTVPRARPFMYDPLTGAAERQDSGAMQSFFSGHTSAAFAMATAYSYLFQLRHSRSPWVVPVWTGTHLVATTVGCLRVAAGKHYWSDVLVGAAVGSAVGFLVPYVHLSKTAQRLLGVDEAPGKPQLAPQFFAGGGGLGLKMIW